MEAEKITKRTPEQRASDYLRDKIELIKSQLRYEDKLRKANRGNDEVLEAIRIRQSANWMLHNELLIIYNMLNPDDRISMEIYGSA